LQERILTIVSIIAQYIIEQQDMFSKSALVEELLSAGFDGEEITAAFDWMESSSYPAASDSTESFQPPVTRVFSAEETTALSSRARGFLMRLHNMGLIDREIEEEVIENAIRIAQGEATLRDVKAIIALALFNHSPYDWKREIDCILENDWSRLYH